MKVQFVNKALVKLALDFNWKIEAERVNGVQTGRLHFKRGDIRGTMSVKAFFEEVI